MFLSIGNVRVNRAVGLLFVDVERQRRPRVDGDAEPAPNDEVRVRARHVYPNCQRDIHKLALVERSTFVPRVGHVAPVPGWRRAPWAADVLPVGGSAAA